MIQNFCSRLQPGTSWAIKLDGMILETPEVVIAETRAKVRSAWKLLLPLTEESAAMGHLPVTDPLRGRILMSEKSRTTVWRTIPQISSSSMLCKVNHVKWLSEIRMLEIKPIATCARSNRHITKLVQVFQPTVELNLHC